MQPRALTVAALLALGVAAAFALYGSTLRLQWSYDDPLILQHALAYSPWRYFTQPAAWQALVAYFLTPWLSLTFDLDHALFGLDPAAFHAHHVAATGLAAGLAGVLASYWVRPPYAAAAVLLVLAGAPVAVTVPALMSRHYTEGFVFFALALWCSVARLRGGRWPLNVAAGLAFAVAASAKEIFLPLGLVPLLLPLGLGRDRLRAWAPYALVMLLYLPWRRYMLGDLIGGYTPAGMLAALGPSPLAAQLAGLPGLLWQPPLIGGAALAVLAGLALWRAPQPRGLAIRLALLGGLVLLPLLPLMQSGMVGRGNERVLVGAWFVLAWCAAVAAGRLAEAPATDARRPGAGGLFHRPGLRHAAAFALLACIGLSGWLGGRPTVVNGLQEQFDQHQQLQALMKPADGVAVQVARDIPALIVQSWVALRPAFGAIGPAPTLIADELDLAALPAPRKVLRYDRAAGGLVSPSPQVLEAELARWRAAQQPVPMDLLLERHEARQYVRWRFGAARPGSFSLISPGQQLPMGVGGAVRYVHPVPPCMRFRFDGADGSIAYTPPLRLPPPDADGLQRLHWQGSGEAVAPDPAAGCPPLPVAAPAAP